MAQKQKGGKGAAKYGRNGASCQTYRSRNQRERNKARKLYHYLRKHGNDKVARNAFVQVEQYLPKELRRSLAA